MALYDIEVPLLYIYNSVEGSNKEEYKLVVNEFAGRLNLTIQKGNAAKITIQCYFDDLKRAWKAVNQQT